MSKLLELRNKQKKKKPNFVRTDGNIFKQFKNWRKPRGRHNKRRLSKKGHQKNPSIGYSSPKEVRGLTRHGLKPILICNINDLNKFTKENIIIISGKLGLNKKLKIIEKIKELKYPVMNIKNIDEFIKVSKEKQETKKQETKKKKVEREQSKKEAEKKKEEKEKKEKTEEKQKDLSKEAKIEQKAESSQVMKEKQSKITARATAPKSI